MSRLRRRILVNNMYTPSRTGPSHLPSPCISRLSSTKMNSKSFKQKKTNLVFGLPHKKTTISRKYMSSLINEERGNCKSQMQLHDLNIFNTHVKVDL